MFMTFYRKLHNFYLQRASSLPPHPPNLPVRSWENSGIGGQGTVTQFGMGGKSSAVAPPVPPSFDDVTLLSVVLIGTALGTLRECEID